MVRRVLQLRMAVHCVRVREWTIHTRVYIRNAKVLSELQATLRWCGRGHVCGLYNGRRRWDLRQTPTRVRVRAAGDARTLVLHARKHRLCLCHWVALRRRVMHWRRLRRTATKVWRRRHGTSRC